MSWLRSKSYSLKVRKEKPVKEKMDAILRGILSSTQPEAVKKGLIQKIADQASQQHAASMVQSVLELTSKWVLDGASELEQVHGLVVYRSWAKYNIGVFEQFFSKEFLLSLLTKKYGNQGKVPVLLTDSMRLLQRSSLFLNHCSIVEAKATGYIREHPYLDCLKHFTDFLLEFKECVPKGELTVVFCTSLIHSMSLCNYPEEESGIVRYIQDVNTVASLLSQVWSNSDSQVVRECLTVIFSIISCDSGEEPSVCLGSIVQYIPTEMISVVVNNVISDPKVDNKSMIAALQRIIDWLQWPTARNVDGWVNGFLLGLASVQKYSILITVTENKVDQIFEKLQFAPVREPGLNIISHMLLSFQHSPDPFHKILLMAPKVILLLKGENSAQSMKILSRLVELLHCLMYLHAGFPDLYDPILTLIKEFPVPSVDVIKFKLVESKWTTHRDGMMYTPKTYQHKAEMGKTGLFNLGNTCYMNSVIQALYMCDSFRNGVLDQQPSQEQRLVVKLQHVFAFLFHSQRPAYAPMNFLTASRPPWFTPGFQQDCSEFLKYLLDQLKEQEQKSLQRKDGTNSSPTTSPTSQSNGSTSPSPGVTKPTLIEQNFGGKLSSTLKCLNCGLESVRTEKFMDIPLAFPDYQTSGHKSLAGGDSKTSAGSSSLPAQRVSDVGTADVSPFLHIADLLKHFLKPEKLTGDNLYHCDNCKGLQEGERKINITDTPEYLLLSLMRFSYDTRTQSRAKIFREVKYPKTLLVPVARKDGQSSEDADREKCSLGSAVASQLDSCGIHVEADSVDVYALCSVVIHSGTSSDCGHYYCYARHSSMTDPDKMLENLSDCSAEDDIDFLPDKWYLFNDSRVSYTSYSSFCNVTQRFSKDTAYVLVYRKVDLATWKPPGAQDQVQPLRADLRTAVTKDNKMYLQEQENAARKGTMRKRSKMDSTASWYSGWRDDDDKGSGGPCGGGGGGLGDLDTSGARFVF